MDQWLRDVNGESRILIEDYAMVMIDEVEKTKHIRQRFSGLLNRDLTAYSLSREVTHHANEEIVPVRTFGTFCGDTHPAAGRTCR